MPKPSGHTVTLEAGGRAVTMTDKEFDRRCREFHRMTPEERRKFLERGKAKGGGSDGVSDSGDVSPVRPDVRNRDRGRRDGAGDLS